MTKRFVINGNFTLEIDASTTVTTKGEAFDRAQKLLDLAQREGLLTMWLMHGVKEVGA